VSAVSRAAVIGESLRVEGYALAGAVVCPADDQAAASAAWRSLPRDICVVVLTAAAAGWLAGELARRPDVVTAVMRA